MSRNSKLSKIRKIIREKKVKVNSKRVDAAYKTQESDRVEIHAELPKRFESQKSKPKISEEKLKKFPSTKIFEDENLLAIDKPSGLATQGGSGIDISVDDFVSLKKWQLVHRLDKDTSGVLLIAKNNETAEFLTDAFRNKTVKKTYLALVNGLVGKEKGTINIPLRKKLLGKNEKVSPDFVEGKEAITDFKILQKLSDYTLLELKPLTGRTHQLRVHCKEIGHPILNDVKYGGKNVIRKDLCKRLCLHASKVEIENYCGKTLVIESALPEFIRKKS